MKKRWIALSLCGLLISVVLIGCAKEDEGVLTLERVRELAQKGEELSWSDFEQYDSEDVGSGLLIRRYAIGDDGTYYLMIGGVIDEMPMYMRLVRAADEEYIDIRTENVDSFIKTV